MNAWTLPPAPALTDAQFQAWHQLLEERVGIDLSHHRGILQNGLNRRLRLLGQRDYDAYLACVRAWPAGVAEWSALLDCLTVRDTRFFRQRAAFDLVASFLLERLTSYPDETLDIWSAGCAGGEEACSLAMVAQDALHGTGQRRYLGVLGSDISTAALAQAQAGRYGDRAIAEVPMGPRQRYLRPDGPGRWRLESMLAARLCWTRMNLLDPAVARGPAMDVIFCQNVLVYFRRPRAAAVLDALAARLKPGGLLVIGPGEGGQWHRPGLQRVEAPGVTAWLRSDTGSASTRRHGPRVPMEENSYRPRAGACAPRRDDNEGESEHA